MPRNFGRFLATKGKLRNPQGILAEQSPHEFREVLGAIALRHGLMTPDQIDEVLLNTSPDAPFHEVARERGYLSEQQIQLLQQCQKLEEAIQIGVDAILAGDLAPEEMLTELQAYFEYQDTPSG